MKKLRMVFKDEEEQRHSFMPKFADEEISTEVVVEVMEEMTQIPIFTRNGRRLFAEAVEATYIEETTLFDHSQNADYLPVVFGDKPTLEQ